MRLLLALAALLLAACQQPPAQHAPVTNRVSPAAQLRAEGDALMASGNYAGAVEKLRQAIDLEPTSVPHRFALGTAYSFLDRRPEAIAQFRWVMANAPAGSVEHQESRRWLVRVAALVEPAAVTRSEGDRTDAAKKVDPSGQGSIAGKTQWPGVTPAEHRVPLRISMLGIEDTTRAVQRRTEVLLGEPFEFKDVPEGQYRVVGIFDDRILWDQSITVKGGAHTELTLNQAASSVPVDTFPPARR